MFGKTFVFFGIVCLVLSEGAHLERMKRQTVPEQGGHVIDNIFNIPITAIKQTAAAAQSFSPGNSQAIESVLQIPISTLEAVGSLVKATSGQRGQSPEDSQQVRRERRDRLLAQREQQRLQREQVQQQRLKQQQAKRTIKLQNHKDPFGLNALSNLLVGKQGLFGGFGDHGGHMILGGHGGHGGLGGHGNRPTYSVHEDIEEDSIYSWHGISAGIGSFYGTRPASASISIQNKIAPKNGEPQRNYYSRMQNKIAAATSAKDELRYEDEPPLQNKIAPRSNRISFQS